MVPFNRSQSRILKPSASRSIIRLNDASSAFRYILWCLAQALLKLWDLNPVSLLLRRWRQLHYLNTRMALSIRPRIIDLVTDFFLSDERRKRKLLSWVKSILPWIGEEVFDFTGCWQDGIVLCALMESVCPGVCPRFSLLKPHHRVNNCRLGIQLAMRYLGVSELPLSPEEMAIADGVSEVKICHLVQLLKWKYQKQGSKPTTFSGGGAAQVIQCKCQARGTGIRAGIVGKRTKFNILTEMVARLDLEIEIRGPHNEYNKEKIISVNPGATARYRGHLKAAALSAAEEDGKTKVIDDGAGHSYLRQKSLDEDVAHTVIPFDYQCVGEGRFLVTYIPRSAGIHNITILSAGVHIEGSPFEVKVSDWLSSWNLVPKPRVVPFDMLQSIEEQASAAQKPADRIMRKLTHVAQVSKQLTRMKRRILRKVITPNGEEIICDVTPTLSRQNSGDSEMSEDDRRCKADANSYKNFQRETDNNQDRPLVSNKEDRGSHTGHGKTSGYSTYLRPEDKSASRNSPTPGSTFAATVLAARTAAASSDKSPKFSNSVSASGISEISVNSNQVATLAANRQDLRASPVLRVEIGRRGADESMTPDIVITPDVDALTGMPSFFFADKRQENNHNNRAGSNVAANNKDEQTESDMRKGVNSPSVSSIATVPSSVSRLVRPSKSNSFGGTVKSENGNNETNLRQCPGGLPLGSFSGTTKVRTDPASPFLKVSDVVESVLINLKQEKRSAPVSPAHRHYLRSFSLDETHQPYPIKTDARNLNYKSSASPLSSSPVESPVSRSHHYEIAESSSTDDAVRSVMTQMSSDISLSGNFQAHSNEPPSQLPAIDLNPRTQGTETDAKLYDPRIREVQNDTYNACLGNFLMEQHKDHKDCWRLSCEDMYCSDCNLDQTGPAIKKQDLDQRVYEIIEEASERDNESIPQEEASETSFDGLVSDQTAADFDLDSSETSMSRFLSGMTSVDGAGRPRLNRSSLSFDTSYSETDHKITWSQHKSLSEERKLRKSLSLPHGDGGFTRKERAEVGSVPVSSAAFIKHIKDEGRNDFTPNFGQDGNDDPNDEREVKSSYNVSNDQNDGLNTTESPARINSKYTSRNQNWAHSRSMSLPDPDAQADSHYNSSKYDAFGFKRRPIRGCLNKTRKWNTFDIDDKDMPGSDHNEVLRPLELSFLSKKSENGDLYAKGNKGVVDSKLASEKMETLSPGITCDRYLTPPRDVSLPENERMLETTQEPMDDGIPKSPSSSASNKSEKSDWSDNENNPSDVSANHDSEDSRHFLKGDWSPQFVDLNYHGDVRSRRGSVRKVKNASPPTDLLHESSIITSPSKLDGKDYAWDSNDYFRIQGSGERSKNSTSSDSYETNGTHIDYTHDACFYKENMNKESFSESEKSRLTSMIQDNISSPAAPVLLANNDSRREFRHIGNVPVVFNEDTTYLKRRHKPLVKEAVHRKTVYDESAMYLKRRHKPIYKEHGSSSRGSSRDNNDLKIDSQSICETNCGHRLVPNEHCRGHNIEHARETKSHFRGENKESSFFSTIELLSPECSNQLPAQSWLSEENNCDGCPARYQPHFGKDSNVSAASEYTDARRTFTEGMTQEMNYFRERSLTPTKYRVKKQDWRENFKSVESSSDGQQFLSKKNFVGSCFTEDDPMKWDWRNEKVLNLELTPNLDSIMAVFSPGDRLLTPTKFRCRVRYYDNRGSRTVTDSSMRELKEFPSYNESAVFSQRRDSAVQTFEPGAVGTTRTSEPHCDSQRSNPRRNEGNTYSGENRENCFDCCDKSFLPIPRAETSQHLFPSCDGDSRNIRGSCLENESQRFIQIQKSSSSKGNLSHKECNRNGTDLGCICCPRSRSVRDLPVDDSDLVPYLKKRRKMVGKVTTLAEASTRTACDSNSVYLGNNQINCSQFSNQHRNFESLQSSDRTADDIAKPHFSANVVHSIPSAQQHYLPQLRQQKPHAQNAFDSNRPRQEARQQAFYSRHPQNLQQHFNRAHHHPPHINHPQKSYVYETSYDHHSRQDPQIHHDPRPGIYQGPHLGQNTAEQQQFLNQQFLNQHSFRPERDQEHNLPQIQHHQSPLQPHRHSQQERQHQPSHHLQRPLQSPQPPSSQQIRHPAHGSDNGEEGLKRQSSVDTLDSGITEDSSHCRAPTSGSDAADSKPVSHR